MARESRGDIGALPEGCIAKAISFTSPIDACRLAVVSCTFKSASESDVVWESFLPKDYHFIISKSSDPSLLIRCQSKKDLYLSLCDNPILIDESKKSFSLEKRSGKKCYIISARDLVIVWGDTPTYWRWIPEPTSRFPEVAKLLHVCWFDIHGKVATSMLSQSTQYAAFLVFKMTAETFGFEDPVIDAVLGLVGSESSKRHVYLGSRRLRRPWNNYAIRGFGFLRARFPMMQWSIPSDEVDDNYPRKRGDGWLEVKLGEFFTKEDEFGELEVRVSEIHSGHWKSGLLVEGIEVRPT